MKLPIVFLAVLGLAFGKSVPDPKGNLQDDLNDFLALVPVDQVLAIAMDYLTNDAQVQELIVYVQSEEFHKIILTAEALQEFTNFVSFLNDLGLDVTGYINTIHDFIGLGPYPAPTRKHMRRGEGVNGLIEDIIAVLPIDDLHALFLEKLETSPDFKAFYDAVGSPEFQTIVETLKAMPEFQDLLQKLRDYGVDVDKYIELLKALFGITDKRPTRNLRDDLDDFLALIPLDEVLSIAMDYLANDAQVQELMAYLQTPEFHTIIQTPEALPEFGNFVHFLIDHGIVDAVNIINSVHALLGIPPYELPATKKHLRRGEGIDGLIQDIIAVIPLDQVLALFQDKLVSSEDFKALYDEIHSAEFRVIIDTVWELQELQDLLQQLRDYGVQVDMYIELIKQILDF